MFEEIKRPLVVCGGHFIMFHLPKGASNRAVSEHFVSVSEFCQIEMFKIDQ